MGKTKPKGQLNRDLPKPQPFRDDRSLSKGQKYRLNKRKKKKAKLREIGLPEDTDSKLAKKLLKPKNLPVVQEILKVGKENALELKPEEVQNILYARNGRKKRNRRRKGAGHINISAIKSEILEDNQCCRTSSAEQIKGENDIVKCEKTNSDFIKTLKEETSPCESKSFICVPEYSKKLQNHNYKNGKWKLEPLPTISSIQSNAEATIINDSQSFEPTQSTAEENTINDSLSFESTQSITEAINGSLSFESTQSVAKAINDSINDSLSFKSTQSIAEAITINDSLSFEPTQSIPEAVITNNNPSFEPTKSIAERIVIEDDRTKDLPYKPAQSNAEKYIADKNGNDILQQEETTSDPENTTIDDIAPSQSMSFIYVPEYSKKFQENNDLNLPFNNLSIPMSPVHSFTETIIINDSPSYKPAQSTAARTVTDDCRVKNLSYEPTQSNAGQNTVDDESDILPHETTGSNPGETIIDDLSICRSMPFNCVPEYCKKINYEDNHSKLPHDQLDNIPLPPMSPIPSRAEAIIINDSLSYEPTQSNVQEILTHDTPSYSPTQCNTEAVTTSEIQSNTEIISLDDNDQDLITANNDIVKDTQTTLNTLTSTTEISTIDSEDDDVMIIETPNEIINLVDDDDNIIMVNNPTVDLSDESDNITLSLIKKLKRRAKKIKNTKPKKKQKTSIPNISQLSLPPQNPGLRKIFIDSSNVAHIDGQIDFSVERLNICIDFFLQRGHTVHAVLPSFRKKPHKTTNPALLNELDKKNLLIFTPSRIVGNTVINSYDDRYIIQCAKMFDGIIVSKDNFGDLLKENPLWTETIKNRVLPFVWVYETIIFPLDPLGRNGPNLEEFLRSS